MLIVIVPFMRIVDFMQISRMSIVVLGQYSAALLCISLDAP